MIPSRRFFVLMRATLLSLLLTGAPAFGQVRIKDITDVEGVRANQLIGYGLVVGLNGTGDKLNNAIFTLESLIGMLERLGVNTRDQAAKLQTKNIAAVMVTAELPAFTHGGSRIDVTVSALGDATNLTGGTLLVTPLLAADGEVYAVAQGAIETGAIAARGAASSVTRGVPTAGGIANGAIVEKEVAFRLDKPGTALRLGLRNPDLTTALRIAAEINKAIGPISKAIDPRTVLLDITSRDPIEVLGRIENLRIQPDNPAIVIIDEVERHDRDGRQREDQHGGDRPGKSDDQGDGDAAGEPAGSVLQWNDHHGPAHANPDRRSARQEARHPGQRRDVA